MASWRLDSTVTERYMKLDQGNNVLATYLWIDGTGVVREGGGGGGGRGWEDEGVCVWGEGREVGGKGRRREGGNGKMTGEAGV